jgi:hypothetical protein
VEDDYFGKLLERSFHLPVIRSTFYSWNNFPRYRGSALVVQHMPGDFERFKTVCARLSASGEPHLINSWNEWSEGAALEDGLDSPEMSDLRI